MDQAVELVLISRHLERIADHITNIGERVYYVETGVFGTVTYSTGLCLPAISTGAYGYPVEQAVPVGAVIGYFEEVGNKVTYQVPIRCRLKVRFVCFDEHTYSLYKQE